jgi:hypothetical protein
MSNYPAPGIGRLKNKELVAEPITAWRAWRAYNNKLYPWSVKGFHWSKGVNKAECRRPPGPFPYAHDDGSPARNCRCGFWAFKSEEILRHKIGSSSAPYAWGKVKLWGNIVEGTYGYRAQYAKIELVILVGTFLVNPPEAFEAEYGVPVVKGNHPNQEAVNKLIKSWSKS